MLPPAWRPLVVRLACALAVIVGCMRIVRGARHALADDPVSRLDAPPSAPPRPSFDERFMRLRDDVRFGLGSQRYFETILWPRLRALGATTPPAVAEPRCWRRRGPSPRALQQVIEEIEGRP
jgi:hypothetical protein